MANGGRVCFLFLVWLATVVGGVHGAGLPPTFDLREPQQPARYTAREAPTNTAACRASATNMGRSAALSHARPRPAGTTSPPAPPPSPPSTTPVTCVSQNGQVYNLGDTYQYGCMPCECKINGEECYPLPCAPPQCENYVTNGPGCCPTCPNGPDCMDSSTGQVIPAGETVETVFGKQCYCPTGSENYGGHPEPMCYYLDVFPTTTLPPSHCYANGHYYQEGEYYEYEPCLTCYCRSYWQEPECYPPACTVPPCPNPVSNGYCCPTCPNGPACLGLQGDEIPQGETRTYPDGSQCHCNDPGYHNGLECIPIPPTTQTSPAPLPLK